jgi:hypothetical protein
MSLPRSRASGLLAALALFAAAPATSVNAAPHPVQAIAAKSCSSGYVHAVMPNEAQKCLRAGQFCSRKRSYQHVYHQKGFHCKRNHHLRHY